MRKLIVALLLLLMLAFATQLGAANIHMHYAESADAFLTTEQFQIFSFAGLQGEKVTIVAYGLDEGMVPGLTLFNMEGQTIGEDLNADTSPIAYIQFDVPSSGLYTFLVSRQTDVGGLMRVMLFEGDPLEGDLSFLDSVDPLLPSRAYLISGGTDADPLEVTLTVLDDDDEATPIPEVFASRATEITLPSIDERTTGITGNSWENEDGDIFYTLNVRPLPEATGTSVKPSGLLSFVGQFLDITNIQIDLGAGSPNPDFLPRDVCQSTVPTATVLLKGPGAAYGESETPLPAGATVEVLFSSGDYYFVIDLGTGITGWLPKSAVIIDVDRDQQCGRVVDIPAPPLPPVAQTDPPPPFGGLPPDPGDAGDSGGDDIIVADDDDDGSGGDDVLGGDDGNPDDEGGGDGGLPGDCVFFPFDDGGDGQTDVSDVFDSGGSGSVGFGVGMTSFVRSLAEPFAKPLKSTIGGGAFGAPEFGKGPSDTLVAICTTPDEICYYYLSGKVECFSNNPD
jgi:hypothetical protein